MEIRNNISNDDSRTFCFDFSGVRVIHDKKTDKRSEEI
jgi:hypothetical protein